jgi:hypothetical protein
MPARLPGFTVSYAKVEAALARMHNIAQEDVPAFRSRLGSLQRGRLLGAENQPGKGQKLQYGPDHFHRLVLAVELTQAGIGPAVILRLVSEQWDKLLRKIIDLADHTKHHEPGNEGDDVVLSLRVDLMFDENGLGISHTTRDRLPQHVEFMLSNEERPARLLLINLSAQLRKFHEALRHYHLQPDRLVEAALVKAKPRKVRAAVRRRQTAKQ